jgi:hypothetical protein
MLGKVKLCGSVKKGQTSCLTFQDFLNKSTGTAVLVLKDNFYERSGKMSDLFSITQLGIENLKAPDLTL